MFSLQQKDELVFGSARNHISHQDKIPDIDLIADPAFVESNDVIRFSSRQQPVIFRTGPRRQKQQTNRDRDVYGIKTKVLHREIERKRRQVMSDLYSSLRGLLPVDLIKGKRSVSDQMQEAVNYIKSMQKSIEELRIRRDRLKESCYETACKSGSKNSGSSNEQPNLVKVNLDRNGLEVLVSCSNSFNGTESRLSKVLAELLGAGISTVNCVSTMTKGRYLHKIHAELEASVQAYIDPIALQERLSHVICS